MTQPDELSHKRLIVRTQRRPVVSHRRDDSRKRQPREPAEHRCRVRTGIGPSIRSGSKSDVGARVRAEMQL